MDVIRGALGFGIAEYATREQAEQAVNTLSNQNLMGRLVYVREDREAEPLVILHIFWNGGWEECGIC
ncbi:hypothetical protein BU16DRAFT_557430 [Lophium mytilinum]|uniref:RRM domain-containing protein n=1 Tax=Lophium mytilinum TaxID=390894 RepID=A0A6A6R6H5_9PEZI|nr:hypothetical protein BU16DRAFT_557430 [Lophium mytilinum]